jgi:hypothetical protein
MTAIATADRTFTLAKGDLWIGLIQRVNGDTATYAWSVLLGGNMVKSGQFDTAAWMPEVLKTIADSVTMPTPMGDMALRTLTWSAMNGFQHVPANELRQGDEIAFGGGAFTVDTVVPQGNKLTVMFTNGPSRRLIVNQLCNLTARGPQA